MDIEVGPPRLIAEHMARYAYAARFVQGRRVLDVAAGTGYGGARLLAAGARYVVEAEIDADAVSLAMHRSVSGQLFVRADAVDLPIGTASLDACVSIETLEHVPDAERAVAEIARILSPGSPFVLTTPNRLSTEIPHDNPFHMREYDPVEVLVLLRRSFAVSHLAGQYLGSSGFRHFARRWLAGSRSAQLARVLLPRRLRTYGGRSLAGEADVIEVNDFDRTRPATLVVVAIRQ